MDLLEKGKYSKEYCELIELIGEQGGLLNQQLSALGISKDTFYRWQKEYPEFKDACDMAKIKSAAYHEELLRRIAEGTAKGNVKASELALKTLDAQTYGSVDPKQVIAVERLDSLSEADLEAAIEAEQKKLDGK